ncbi:MAG: VanW family protein [Propionibacteriaceae bacterium]|nr:VanW family protein [Propionibacteriaceae bacterium]
MSTSPRKAGKGKWIALIASFVLLVGVGVTYLVGYGLAGEKLPVHATISGIDVGGLTRAAAVSKLQTDLSSGGTITIKYGAESVTLQRTAVASVDYDTSVANAGGGVRSWNPLDIINQLFGGGETEVVSTVNESVLAASIRELAAKVDRQPVDASVAVVDGAPQVTAGVVGQQLDVSATVAAVSAGLLTASEFEAVVAEREPAVTTAAANAAAQLAVQAMSGPVTVTVGDKGKLTLRPETIAATLVFTPSGGGLGLGFDSAALNGAVAKDLDELGLTAPVDAKFTISGKKSGKPKIKASVDGAGIDVEQLAERLVPALSGTREVAVDVAPRPAQFTTADAEAMGVKEITGEFTTVFPGSTYRWNNIGKAAKLINGTYVAPGETFSMNQCLGERTKAAGWMAGGGIANGKIDPNIYGGGVSQSTTTTFNAIFFAGLEDVYHKPHSLYFSRYPKGREATLDWKMVDMKFKNDSPYGVLLQAWITGKKGDSSGKVTVRVWSTKVYEIKTSKLKITNRRSPGPTKYDDSADCVPQSAMSGFDVSFNRLFYKDGELVKKEPFKWSYNTLTKVVCGKKPK